jgi:hypothetical protein
MIKILHFIGRATSMFIFGFGIAGMIPLDAQVPDYFANHPEWRMNTAFGVNGPCVTEIDYVLYVQGDTVIGPYTYKKMRTRGTYHYIYVMSPGCSETDHFADLPNMLLRQDSTRIWQYNNLGDELLYDFNLQVGDTLPMGGYNSTFDTIVVDSISTLMVSNAPRKVFHLSTDPFNLLIEGIGGLTSSGSGGFLVSYPPCFECEQGLSCYSMNDTVYYPSLQAPCSFNVGIEQVLKKQPITFYPNPVEDFVVLKLPDDHLIKIACTNLMGQSFQVKFEQISPGEWKLNTSSLIKGIYFLNIEQEGVHSSIKIIKN